jgi:HSP20 family molecular chaperone IbpA
MQYTNNNNVTIEIRHAYRGKIAWAEFVNGKYQRTKVLPANNTAVVQNFGYLAKDFQKV